MIVEEFKMKKKINLKIIINLVIVVLIIAFLVSYYFIGAFKNKVDSLFKFTIESEKSLATIYMEQDTIGSIYGYDKYFSILSQNTLKGYMDSDKEHYSHTINITNSISSNNGKYLAISEKETKNIYLLCGKELVYEKQIEETISDIFVNKNGYVAISCSKSGYRSIIKLFNPNGEEVFTTYLANTYASDISISNNNKYLAISEVDTSGIKIQSSIKTIEIAKANTQDYIINLITEEGLISHMNFYNNKEIMYISNNQVKQIDIDKNEKVIYTINSNILNIDISIGNYIILVEKSDSSIFNVNTDIVILNKEGKEVGRYKIDGTIKQVVAKNNVICANMGQKLCFLTITGRPLKEYSTNLEAKNITIFDNGNKAGIIYRNKIEIINI